MADQGDHHQGHRARLRQRLLDGGDRALLDHELVEYLLTLAIPRRDTKALAKSLIARFGGLGALLDSDPEALRKEGLTEGVIGALKIAEATALRLLETRLEGRPVLSSWDALGDYLQAAMGHQGHEEVRVLYLNARNILIANEMMSRGSVDEAAIYVREIIERAIRHKASAIILVHNHPSGDSAPSKADIRLTRDLIEAGRHMKVVVHDHVIVGATGRSSMRSLGLI